MSRLTKLFLYLLFCFLALGVSGKVAFAQSCGLNIDPTNPTGYPTPGSIAGVRWVRVEFKNCTTTNDDPMFVSSLNDYEGVISTYVDNGIKVLLILDYLTISNAREEVDAFAERAGLIAERYSSFGTNVAYQIWNEPDIWMGGTMDPAEYANILSKASTSIKAANPSAIVVTGSSASGQSQWMSDVRGNMGAAWANVDKVAIHSYGKNPGIGSATCDIGNTGPLSPHINDYYAAGNGKPLWITEIGMNTPDGQAQATYLQCFYSKIRAEHSSQVENVLWFAWSDGMVSPMGIVTDSNSPKPAYSSYFSANGCVDSNPSSPAGLSPIPFLIGSDASCGNSGSEPVEVTIKGIIRSSRKLPSELGAGDGETSGQAVYGAVITAFKGNTDRGRTGKCDGALCNQVAVTASAGNGEFELTTVFDPTDNFEGSQYVAVSCNGKVRELYKIPVNEGNLEGVELFIDSEKHCTPFELAPEVYYMITQDHLSCREDNDRNTITRRLIEQQAHWDSLRQVNADSSYIGNNSDPDCTPSGTNAVGMPAGCAPYYEGGSLLSTEPVEGKVDVRARTENITENISCFLWGGPCNRLPPRTPEEELNNLPLASEVAECNTATVAREGGSGLNTQTCGGPLTHLMSPTDWARRYWLVPKTTPIAKNDTTYCTDKSVITLGDITIPTSWGAQPNTGCTLPFEYLNYRALVVPGNPDSSGEDRNSGLMFNDSLQNSVDGVVREGPGSDNFRTSPFVSGTKGEKPAYTEGWNVLPSGSPLGSTSLYNEECALKGVNPDCTTGTNGEFVGPAAGLFRGRSEIFGTDQNGQENPNAQKPKLGRGIYRLGYPMHSLCTCNEVGGCSEESLNNKFTGQGVETGDEHLAVAGYKFCTPIIPGAAPICLDFFGEGLVNALMSGISQVVNAFFSVWIGNINPGGACAPMSWGQPEDGPCPVPLPVNQQCEIVSCTFQPPRSGVTQCPDPAQNCLDGYVAVGPFQYATACTHRMSTPGPYDCSGDVEVFDARFDYYSPSSAVENNSAVDQFVQYFYPVRATLKETADTANMMARGVGGLFNYVYNATNEAFPCENCGHDFIGLSSGSHFATDMMKMFVSDPKALSDSDEPAPSTIPYTATGGGNGGGLCNPFNCFAGYVIDFETSLQCAISSVRFNEDTWRWVDMYGPYCDNETKRLPFAYNLFVNIIDVIAPPGAGRVCENQDPPNTVKPGTEGMFCPTFTDPIRLPGHPSQNLEYYRGALFESSGCPMVTHQWPSGLTPDDVVNALDGANYLGYTFNYSNPLSKAQLDRIIERSQDANVNPFILIGIWGTESAWSMTQSCATPTT